MSVSAWTRKYRPRDLESYVGNSVIKQKVKSMFKNKRVPQTILLEGDRGCGKTTLARIMSRNLMCQTPDIDGQACGLCKNCEALEKFIGTGESVQGMNVYEIDITKSKGVEDAAKLVEQMKVRPMGGRKKIYILDEIQRASPEAQNSYLKIAEEPGDYLYIILCTTDPQDLIDPFKSRFNSLKVKRPTVDDVVERLVYICENENKPYEEAALRMIANHSNRVPRECINKLDMVAISGQVTTKLVQEELQQVGIEVFHKYFKLLGRDIFDAMSFIENLYEEHNVEWGDFLSQLSNYAIDMFNMRLGIRLESYTDAEYKHARSISKPYDTKELARFLALIREALKLKENPRQALILLTLEFGFPEYLELKKGESAEAEVKRETKQAMTNYMKKKDEDKLDKESRLDKHDEMTEEDLINLLPGTELVEIDLKEKEAQVDDLMRMFEGMEVVE